jgi:hypothetical protein
MTSRHRLVALAAVALLVATCSGSDDSDDAGAGDGPAVLPADEGMDHVNAVRIVGGDHTTGTVDYGRRPPAGGDHHPVWTNCGFYDEAIPDEHVVHDLEHGAIWLAYAPELGEADRTALHEVVRSQDKVVATPYTGLPDGVEVVALAWARELFLADVGDPRLVEFIERYRDGDQAPEAGVTCVDSPLGEPLP